MKSSGGLALGREAAYAESPPAKEGKVMQGILGLLDIVMDICAQLCVNIVESGLLCWSNKWMWENGAPSRLKLAPETGESRRF